MRVDDAGVPPVAFVQLLKSNALDLPAVERLRRVMTREEVDVSTLVKHGVQAPLRWFREVYPGLDVNQATLLGVAFAGQAQLTSFGPLSFPLVSAGSVAEIMKLLEFLPLITTAVSPHFCASDRGLTVGFTGHTSDSALDCLAVTYCGSVLLRLLDMLVDDARTITLHIGWPAPVVMTEHEDNLWLAGRLLFDAPMSYLHVPADTLSEVCRFSDPVAYRLAVSELTRDLDQRSGTTSYSAKVRQLLEEDPSRRSSQSVSDELSVSTSTLKRRLAEEGTTFRELRESCLRENAVLLLLTRSMSASQIATELGYGDPTNFSHAFKRWTGLSPRQFRLARR
ncbi:helix-turn-helix domain-containing protein [Mycobacterium paraterrae]|uniref:AraC family transcriptional regulator n=1 Tax=Mycobacterium paraterrae TaxID=577492 RepID=A0ABY3VXY3_9MYCO|nr:AraC family transcriptional regulator [Mycobacterium paraterrae]UMB72066.1 AraC family transcriptional regulator [Mycobacterium paraterrae]